MAMTRSAALVALLLASASVASPAGGEGADADAPSLLSLPATSAQHGEQQQSWQEPLVKAVRRYATQVADLTVAVGDVKNQVSELKASVGGGGSTTECCPGVKGEVEAKLAELNAEFAKLPKPDKCQEEITVQWRGALEGLDLKAECRNVDATRHTIKKTDLAPGKECATSGSTAVAALFGEAKVRCLDHCRTFGGETGRALANQYCNSKNITLENYTPAWQAFPSLDGGYVSGTVVDSCFKQQLNGCLEVLKASTSPCDTGRPFETDITKAYTFCWAAQHALNP